MGVADRAAAGVSLGWWRANEGETDRRWKKISAASEGVRCTVSIPSFFLVSSLLVIAEVGQAELGAAVAVVFMVGSDQGCVDGLGGDQRPAVGLGGARGRWHPGSTVRVGIG